MTPWKALYGKMQLGEMSKAEVCCRTEWGQL